jgi:hypothetical protein
LFNLLCHLGRRGRRSGRRRGRWNFRSAAHDMLYFVFELVWIENIFVLYIVLITKEIYNRPLTVVIVQVSNGISGFKVSHRKRLFKRFHKLD